MKGDRPVPELIQAEFRRARQRVTSEQIEDWLLADQLILLLDGVNEIPNDDLRRRLAQFREDNLTVPMIFTTRELAVGGDLGIGKRLEMKPLSELQMRDFVKKYLPEHGEQLLTQLRDRLREIAETPLFLKMLCDVFKQTREIPQNKGELFRQFDRNYERLKKDYVPVSKNFWEFKSEVLQHLAFSMIQADGQKPTDLWLTISKHRAESLLENWLHQRGVVDAPTRAKEWLKDLCNHHLLQDAAKPGEIEFHHQLFQEYYAAEYLLQHLPNLSDEQLKRDYLNYLKWTEAIALMLSLLKQENQALHIVRLALDVDLMLGARLAGDVHSAIQRRAIELMNISYLHDSQISDWLRIELLGETKSQEAIPFLKRIYNNNSKRIIINDSTLGTKEKANVQLLLLGCLDHLAETSKFSQNWVSSETDSVGDDTDQKHLNPYERVSIDFLEFLGKNEPDAYSSYVRSLNLLSTENRLFLLSENLKAPDQYIRLGAIHALAIIGTEEVVPLLLEVMEDPKSPDRNCVAEVLGRLRLKSAIPKLTQLIRENRNEGIRLSAVYALNIIGSQEVIPGLLLGLQDSSVEICRKAINGFYRVESEEAIPALLRAVFHSDHSVYQGAISILRDWSAKKEFRETLNQTAVPILIQKLKCSEFNPDWSITFTLWNILSEEQIILLRDSLDFKSLDFKMNLCVSLLLGKFGYREAIPGLLQAIQHSNYEVRLCAAYAIEQIAGNITSQYLPNLLPLTFCEIGEEALKAIIAIQKRCGYYNYEIAHGLIPQGRAVRSSSPFGVIALYFSYASEDEELRDKLEKHLSILKREGVITSWDSRQILPGDETAKVISDHLNTTDIILLLISPDSIADSTCYDIEIKRAMERHQAGEARVIPILLRPVDWQDAPFSQLEVLPKNKQPVTSWANQDEAFEEIAKGIREVAIAFRR
ncbi:MAG: HEAT repeat domain-containing protein [Oculatellaceae cyanobacterium bins.114]|nr:HEAT repeat domain-containing protein [Oculatellaceae cyanobacterium bins.114]